MAKCDGADCHADIVWAVTPEGKRQPFDREPNPEGNRVLLGRGPMRAPLAIPPARIENCPDDVLYMPHHATCPNVRSFQ